MARHPFGPRAGRRNRNRTYTILVAVLVVCVAIAFYYGPFGKNEAEPINETSNEDTNNNLIEPYEEKTQQAKEAVNEPEVIEEPKQEEMTTSAPPVELPKAPEPTVVAPEPAPGPTIEPNPEAATLITEATALLSESPNKIIEVRDKLSQVLRMPMSPQQRKSVKEKLTDLSSQWLYSRTVFPDDPLCASHQVKPGEILEVIGKKNNVPYELLMTINRISRPESLQAGQAIKIVKGPFHAKVYRSNFTMDIYLQNTYVRSYTVGLGKPGRDTPTGLWRLRPGGKAHQTSWRDPDSGRVYQPEDPDYPLGSRWMALDGLSGEAKDRSGFGIHGTIEPEQIGSASSRGCIRLHNGDVIEVYNMLIDGQSQVEVSD